MWRHAPFRRRRGGLRLRPPLCPRRRRRRLGGLLSGLAGAALRVPFGDLALDYREKRAAIDAAIARVLGRGWFILGQEVEAFEKAFAKFLGVAHVVACANGTEAIALALRALGATPDDEVVVPANTCGPTLAGVRMSGARPVLADVDPDTLTLDAANAGKALTPAARFLLPVHLYGGLADLPGLVPLAASRGLTLVEDCAQSHGALLQGRAAGSFGKAAAFSFYPSKNLGAYGDGGAVVTSDEETAARLRELRQYGWSRRDFAEREGWNSRLDELQAAILSAKLPFLAKENARRLEIANRYDAAFARLPLRRLAIRPGSVPARHLYPIVVDQTEQRDALREHLSARGVETAVHYPVPLHLQPAYAFLGRRAGDYPVSEKACATVVSLPLYASLSDEQVEAVVAAVSSFFEEKR
jgi:dTDP-4-amino-4,6-dideoxygalactose transaminase